MRARPLLTVLIVLLAVAPVPGRAAPVDQATIESINPSTVVAGAPETTFEVEGTNFQNGSAGPVAFTTHVIAESSQAYSANVPAQVHDESHLSFSLPSDFFEEPGDVTVWVYNEAVLPAAGGIPTNLSFSTGTITVEENPAEGPASLRLTRWEDPVVGGCFSVYVEAVDRDGESVGSPSNVSFLSDDPSTPELNDGGLRFYTDWCDGEPVEGPVSLEWGDIYVRGDVPRTVVIEASSEEPPLVGRSEPFRIAGAFISGRVVDDATSSPVAGVSVYRTWGGGGVEVPVLRAVPSSYTPYHQCYAPWAVADVAMSSSSIVPPSRYDPNGELLTVTDADGHYGPIPVAPGSFPIAFRAPAATNTASEFSGDVYDREHAQSIDFQDGADVVLDAALAPGGSLSGVVATSDGGVAGDTLVEILDPSTGGNLGFETAADHAYQTVGLRPGNVIAHFIPQDDAYQATYYDDSPDIEHATPVPLVAGADIENIDGLLRPGASFAGTLTWAGEGATRVYVYSFDTGRVVASAFTQDGTFRTRPGLPAGAYELFVNPTDGIHAPAWVGGSSFRTATTFHLQQHQTMEVHDVIGMGGRIEGRVSSLRARSAPLGIRRPARVAGVYVMVFDEDGHWVGCARSDDRGAYSVSGLPTGDYTVQFDPPDPGLAPEWSGDAPDREHATPVHVTAGDAATLNTFLGRGASISGSVSSSDEDFVWLELWRDGEGLVRSNGFGGSGGRFQIRGLPAGTYRLRVVPQGRYDEEGNPLDAVDAPTWFGQVGSRAAATPITLTKGERRLGVDVTLSRAGSIDGNVSEPATLDIIDAVSFELIRRAWGDGGFSIGGLHPGSYLVRAMPWDEGAPTYYGGSGTAVGATPIVVAPDAVTYGIDITPLAGQPIEGSVLAAHSHAGVPWSPIEVFDAATGDAVGWGSTDEEGHYRTSALAPGDYKIAAERNEDWYWEFWYPRSIYESEWFDGARSFGDADVVTVHEDDHTHSIDVELDLR
jgi:hypothetical protein